MAELVTRNREVFAQDPMTATIPNNGVATVAEGHTAASDEVLRYELRTFVCEGEYARGLRTILDTYVGNVGNPEQPAVWVSGFYGSGKSHLVKVLRYLWTDFKFADGSTARGLVSLPQEIDDALHELSIAGRQAGGLHAVAGTLGAGAQATASQGSAASIRLSLLSLLFRSAGLPEQYPATQLILWLRSTGTLDSVRAAVEAAGKDFTRELGHHMYVSPSLAGAILMAHPTLASDTRGVHALLKAQFPNVADISMNQTLDAIDQVLGVNGKMPCTLIVLDEVQQYIGDNADRSYAVQELTEACSKRFAGRVLFVGTGQSALYGTALLQRLQGRFTVTVELSDSDVETVTRKIVLRKAPSKLVEVEAALGACSGEIRRQLSETKIRPSGEDDKVLAADYPLLPVRRRFWERVLRAVDRAGTAGQLRTQLKIVFEAVRHVAEQPLGTVVAADFVYNELASNMLQTGVLLREVHEIVGKQRKDGKPDGVLRSRLCATIFLINKLPREGTADAGIRATPEALADLLVEDLQAGSADLRKRLPALLDGLMERGDLIKVEGEYRIQTREGATWTSDFQDRLTRIRNDEGVVAAQRAERLKLACGERLKDIKMVQGDSKTPRKLETFFGSNLPAHTQGVPGTGIPVWIRDGWSDDEKHVVADARQVGPESPMIFAFLPRRAGEEFRNALAGKKAAEETLALRGIPSSPEGQEARGAIETRRDEYERALDLAVRDILDGARIFQGGGNELLMDLKDGVQAAAQASLIRRYPQFEQGDNPKWERVSEQARKGVKSPLAALPYDGDAEKQPVCASILNHIGGGKRGGDVRKHFTAPPYGWPQDTVDGALLALFAGGCVRSSLNGTPLEAANLTGPAINAADFKVETVVITVMQRIAVRKLLQDNGVSFKQNEEGTAIPALLTRLLETARAAGGAAPLPILPDTAYLDEVAQSAGNAQIRALYDARERVANDVQGWKAAADMARARLPRWQTLQKLLVAGQGLADNEGVRAQADAIAADRRLLADVDPVPPLCAGAADGLRHALMAARDAYAALYTQQIAELRGSAIWSGLGEEQQRQVLSAAALAGAPEIKVGTEAELLASAQSSSLAEWRNRTDALTQRFANARLAAQKLVAPKAEVITLPRGSFSTVEEARAWFEQLQTIGRQIVERVEEGAVVVVE